MKKKVKRRDFRSLVISYLPLSIATALVVAYIPLFMALADNVSSNNGYPGGITKTTVGYVPKSPKPENLPLVEWKSAGDKNNGIVVVGKDSPFLDYVSRSAEVFPGAVINNVTSMKMCSAGWVAKGNGEKTYIITAGHCGEEGDVFYAAGRFGSMKRIGYMKNRLYDETGRGSNDYGIIEIDNPHVSVSANIPVSNDSGKLSGVITHDQATRRGMKICHIGFHNAVACGNGFARLDKNSAYSYFSMSREGESGGPVFAVDTDGHLYALGVHTSKSINQSSKEDKSDKGKLLYQPLDKITEKMGLEISGN